MAQIILPIPDPIANRVLLAFTNAMGYRTEIENPDWNTESPPAVPRFIPNPVTRLAYARIKLLDYIKSIVKATEANNAAETARLAAIEAAENEIILS